MTYLKYTALLALLAATIPICASAAQIHWYDDYGAAKAEAAKTGKPIFLAFRCSP